MQVFSFYEPPVRYSTCWFDAVEAKQFLNSIPKSISRSNPRTAAIVALTFNRGKDEVRVDFI